MLAADVLDDAMCDRLVDEGLATIADPSVRAALQEACRLKLVHASTTPFQLQRQQKLLFQLLSRSHLDREAEKIAALDARWIDDIYT